MVEKNELLFLDEDEPLYKEAIVIPYWYDKSDDSITLYMRKADG